MAEKELFTLEDSLKDYLIDDHMKNVYENEDFNIYKYKALRVTIDTSGNFKEPNFKVQIGILEAYFTIMNGAKLSGSLGSSDEVLIKKWIQFGSNRTYLRMYWLGESIDKSQKLIKPFDMD